MSKTTENKLTMHYHGKFGDDFVLRMRNGVSVLCKLHDYSKAIWTTKQNQNRGNFRKSARWAQEVLKDEKVKRYFKKKAKGGQSAYNMAIKDHMRQLSLEADFSQFDLNIGGKINFRMKHEFGASYVEVRLIGPGEVVIERGMAKSTEKGFGWEFNAKGGYEGTPYKVEIVLHRGPASFTRTFYFPKPFK